MSQPSTSTGDGAVVGFLKRRWLAILILVVVVVLVLVNRGDVDIDLVFHTFSTPLWVVILGSFVLGGIAGWIACSRRASRKR